MEARYQVLYDLLKSGAVFGKVRNVTHPYFDVVMRIENNYIEWRHFGSSANKVTMEDLKFVIEKIFDMTPLEFMATYACLSRDDYKNLCAITLDAETKRVDDLNKGLLNSWSAE